MCALLAAVVLDMGDASNKAIPRWPWFVFLAGAMGCLICSSLSHLFACHSKHWNVFFWHLDYAGISLIIVCSFFARIYYAFSYNPYSRFLYLTSISLLGILVIITLLAPSLSTPRFQSFKASLFLAMGFSGVIPATHDVVFFWGHPQMLLALGYELVMGVLHAVGASFYMRALAHSAATLLVMDCHRGIAKRRRGASGNRGASS
ncbi:Heptahelical transmembrane protein 2 [Camellia lanceoleosa]|uniref:Heptahelical transmembrane protein 2 n=1 Tax=Camellia lanceoleosa TaxID=1840588 RepID=A0ACC0G9W1_9ERIC|nr:Heptahelical transmembrane protein 2 [Camellia lanceoleosa]